MQCNTLIRKCEKKEVFLHPSSLTGGLRVSFMCWIHPSRPPGSINCLLHWSSVPQRGTTVHVVDSSLSTMALILFFYVTHIEKKLHFLISSCYKLDNVFFLPQKMASIAPEDKPCNRWDMSCGNSFECVVQYIHNIDWSPSYAVSLPCVQVVTGKTKYNLFGGI